MGYRAHDKFVINTAFQNVFLLSIQRRGSSKSHFQNIYSAVDSKINFLP